jgi:Sporulation and spore germination
VNSSVATPGGAFCQTPVDFTQPPGGVPVIINRFDIGSHEPEWPPYDRVVVGLTSHAVRYQVRYVPRVIQDGSGNVIELRGDADLEVRIGGAAAHDDNGQSTLPQSGYTPDWRSLREARLVSDFEGYVSFGIGLFDRVDFKVFTLTGPDRLVIDFARPHQHPWSCDSGLVEVYLLDEPRYAAATEPFFVPVHRRVATPAVASGALNSLFQGLSEDEYHSGLRFVDSDATGFTDLQIADGIARVRLTGGCDSHGSTITIADHIVPTLKQFSTVQYVKIYDPAGQTADPGGPSDSIPDCLNP